jgi:hypothetical protein
LILAFLSRFTRHFRKRTGLTFFRVVQNARGVERGFAIRFARSQLRRYAIWWRVNFVRLSRSKADCKSNGA